MTKKKAKTTAKPPAPSATSAPPPGGTERTMSDLMRLLGEQNFKNAEEANQFMHDLMQKTGGFIPPRSAESALDKAQDLIFQAWETRSRAQRIKLARRALMISPDCVDAFNLLAEDNAETPAESCAFYEAGMKAGERTLGKDFFTQNEGHFWGLVETRPYMRARFGLAITLRRLGRMDEADKNLRELLRLNPNDNQGVRYELISLLNELGDTAAVDQLMAQYENDASAEWQYAAALNAFRKHGASKEAEDLLEKAIACNPHVPDYLLMRKLMPSELPDYIQLGAESEAIHCVLDALPFWGETPGALEWLRKTIEKMPPKASGK